MHEQGAGLGRRGGDVARAVAVDGGRRGLLGLGAVDVGPGRAVDHGVGPGVEHRRAHGGGVGDVEIRPGEGHDLVAGVVRSCHHVAAEHARGARHKEAHGAQ